MIKSARLGSRHSAEAFASANQKETEDVDSIQFCQVECPLRPSSFTDVPCKRRQPGAPDMQRGSRAIRIRRGARSKVGGRRVKTIDVHCHCAIPESLQLMGLKVEATRAEGIAEVGRQRIGHMDRQGIDVEVLSINPYWYETGRDLAAEVVRINNERLAEFCGTHPDRIAAFASVALQFPDLAVQQIEHAVKKLGLRGAAVGAACAGDEFSDPKFHPFWAKCQDLGVLVFIHPQSTPETEQALQGKWLAFQCHRKPPGHHHLPFPSHF